MTTIDQSILSELTATLGRLAKGTSITASNVANVDTPGYRALQVQFSDALDGAGLSLSVTTEGHLTIDGSTEQGTVSEAPITQMRPDGNTVDIDREMTQLAALGGRFAATAQMLRKHMALLRYAATDGKQ